MTEPQTAPQVSDAMMSQKSRTEEYNAKSGLVHRPPRLTMESIRAPDKPTCMFLYNPQVNNGFYGTRDVAPLQNACLACVKSQITEHCTNQMWRCMPVIPAPGSERERTRAQGCHQQVSRRQSWNTSCNAGPWGLERTHTSNSSQILNAFRE